ncbi:MAG: hypothetical protein ABIO92_04905 [Chloroflexia bacterium]
MTTPGFKFIDLPTSAERLKITRNQLLQLVEEGRIRPFSGKGQQSVFRATDVDKLASDLRAATASENAEATEPVASTLEAHPQIEGTLPAATDTRTRRRDAIKLMGTRLSMDSRWAEMSDKDIATWLDALEEVQFERVRKVAGIAIERLQRVLQMMDDFEKPKRS